MFELGIVVALTLAGRCLCEMIPGPEVFIVGWSVFALVAFVWKPRTCD